MVTKCCIEGCWYKYPDPTVSKENSKTFFRFPDKDTLEREKWMKNAGPHIKERFRNRKFLYVCEDHFEEECFCRDPIQIFVNGKRKTVPRKRVRLWSNSVPTKFKTQLPLNDTTDLSTSPPHIFNSVTQPTSSNNAPSEDVLQSFLSPERQPLASLPSHHQEPLSTSPRNASCPTELSMDNNTPANLSAVDDVKVYTMDNLIDDWNNRGLLLAQPWTYIRAPGIGVKFVCYLHEESSNWRGILVRNDMTIQAMTRGNLVNYQTKIFRILCFDDLLSAIREVSALQVCEGSFGESCPTGLYIRKPTRKCSRCFDCQKKYKREFNNIRKRRIRAEKKRLTRKQVRKRLQQQLARSNEKLAKLKEVVDTLQKSSRESESDRDSPVLPELLL